MLITFVRSIVLYTIVLIVMRLMGKREIGQLQPFELAISIMIADLASIPMTETGIPISRGIIPILGLLIMHLLISVINLKSIRAREIICGKPRILIYRGKIDEKALIKERFTINELQERLRGNNVVNLGDVEYAILETSGQVTVIPKPNKRPTTPEDFNIEPKYEGIPYDLVVDGVVMEGGGVQLDERPAALDMLDDAHALALAGHHGDDAAVLIGLGVNLGLSLVAGVDDRDGRGEHRPDGVLVGDIHGGVPVVGGLAFDGFIGAAIGGGVGDILGGHGSLSRLSLFGCFLRDTVTQFLLLFSQLLQQTVIPFAAIIICFQSRDHILKFIHMKSSFSFL